MKNPIQPILLIEDDTIDIMTIKRALKELQIPNPLDIVKDGEEALKRLLQSHAHRPGIILLDLNMPKMGGLEFLHIVKYHEYCRHIPIIILTTSRDDHDRSESFRLGAVGYMVKPVDYKEFVKIIETIDAYWTLSEMPPEESL